MKDQEIANKTSDTLTDTGQEITIIVNHPGILHHLHILPTSKKFILKPLVLGTLQRISAKLVGIGCELKSEDMWEESLKSSATNSKEMAEIIALAIWNRKQLPPKSLVEFIYYNLSSAELFNILMVVIKQMNVKDFMTSIMSVRGLSLLNRGSQIAPGSSLEE